MCSEETKNKRQQISASVLSVDLTLKRIFFTQYDLVKDQSKSQIPLGIISFFFTFKAGKALYFYKQAAKDYEAT